MPDRFQIISAVGNSVTVWSNPPVSEFITMPASIRFTAYDKTQTVYMWDFGRAYHSDISLALRLDDTFESLDFLKGHAWRDSQDEYEIVGSDFLESIARKSCNKNRIYLLQLLDKDWSWLSRFAKIEKYLDILRKHK